MYTEDFPGNHDFLRIEFSMDVQIYPPETDMRQQGSIYEQKYK